MKKLALSVIVAVMAMFSLSSVAMVLPVSAKKLCPDGKTEWTSDYAQDCLKAGNNSVNSEQTNLMGVLNVVINVVLGVVGFVAVAMIIMGGISYTTSQGDAAKTTKARNTILYGVVGLVIALLAFAIVNFVLSNVFGGNTATGA